MQLKFYARRRAAAPEPAAEAPRPAGAPPSGAVAACAPQRVKPAMPFAPRGLGAACSGADLLGGLEQPAAARRARVVELGAAPIWCSELELTMMTSAAHAASARGRGKRGAAAAQAGAEGAQADAARARRRDSHDGVALQRQLELWCLEAERQVEMLERHQLAAAVMHSWAARAERLVLRGPHVRELPAALGALGSLRTLTLEDLDAIALPEDLGRLHRLEALVVRDCPRLRTLGIGVAQLTDLRAATLTRLPQLRGVPSLPGCALEAQMCPRL